MDVQGLHGVHVALATPIDPGTGHLDPAGLERLVDRVVGGGIDAICPTGSTGEGPRLTRAQRLTILQTVRERVGPDRVVLPGASSLNLPDAIAEVNDLAAAGASAVLLAPPAYYPQAPAEVVAWYRTVTEHTDCPLVLYNIPVFTKISIAPAAVAELAALPGVIGIKDSSRDLEYLQLVLHATADADFAVLTGSDTLLLASLVLGADGMIAAGMNLVPDLGRIVFDAVKAGDLGTAEGTQRLLSTIVQACRAGQPPAGWKAALAWAGICSDALVPPAAPLTDEARATLAAALDSLLPRPIRA
ncbi:dihydrodipicolinate synthase family protein [Microlunatus speluncae]|uniref:dihydrodipicolinate synthase family protein n=1 Tax=Microlunatus speluncae TaxID=2594267 RepID=UPI0013755C6C|nr:dihydrodipicolinate synthase family protein [Microlunatus speluncae]